ncbi:hypothetical protein EMPS_03107 [Entomortierella parvispora]|uniref:Uncharacterized protein n=1 Tax=Entomortierella parvispora TaxID=205924 RepID=A0A9P3H6R0_9FUNG|nr:hypothetical protein EMPS_03107 [Entomortierella parvispora]
MAAQMKKRPPSDSSMNDSNPSLFVRHHRRSVDRVWPPALEVRIARLSIDEGSSRRASIIPVPPGLPTHQEAPDDVETDDGSEPTTEKAPLSGNRAVAAAFHFKEGVVAKESGSGSVLEAKNKRRGSIMGPLSPSSHLGIQHNPHIDIRYNKQQKSPSKQGQEDYFSFPGHHNKGRSVDSIDLNGSNSKSSKSSSWDSNASMKNSAPDSADVVSPGSARRLRSCSVVYTESPMILNTNEFGDDLFGKQHTMDLGSSSTISIDSPYITDWVDSTILSTGVVVESPITDAPTLHHRRPEYHENGLFPADYTFGGGSGNTGRIISDPLVASAMKKPKNPLSAASSQSVSPLGLAPSRSPAPKRSRSPLGELSLNTINDNSNSSRGNGIQSSGLRIQSSMVDRVELSSPRVLDILPSDEQDRWKSPTLSALASPVLGAARSRGQSPSLRPHHSRHHSHNGIIMNVQNVSGKNQAWQPTFEPNEIEVEMPSIEARDEIPLQDIWRMEDEERKDRLATGAVGEQHAHEEAQLIQKAIHTADPA